MSTIVLCWFEFSWVRSFFRYYSKHTLGFLEVWYAFDGIHLLLYIKSHINFISFLFKVFVFEICDSIGTLLMHVVIATGLIYVLCNYLDYIATFPPE